MILKTIQYLWKQEHYFHLSNVKKAITLKLLLHFHIFAESKMLSVKIIQFK